MAGPLADRLLFRFMDKLRPAEFVFYVMVI